MKSYIIHIMFEEIEQRIWRRVIMPADATFNRLHDVIQTVTNFNKNLASYPIFNFPIDSYFITNDEAVIEKGKKKAYQNIEVKRPQSIKISTFLERDGELIYHYGLNDEWKLTIQLDSIVEDYYFGYPTLLDGEGIAPPENVDGPNGFKKFKEIYEDSRHPEFLRICNWAETQEYFPIDTYVINQLLKQVHYKKTEWDKIDHRHHIIQTDRYRGPISFESEEFGGQSFIIKSLSAAANLYGAIPFAKFVEIFNDQNGVRMTTSMLKSFTEDLDVRNEMCHSFVYAHNHYVVHESIYIFDEIHLLVKQTKGKPYYIPNKTEFLNYTDDLYHEKTKEQKQLMNLLMKEFIFDSKHEAEEEIEELILNIQTLDSDIQSTIQAFLAGFEFKNEEQMNIVIKDVMKVCNTTRIWENRGHTPKELSKHNHSLMNQTTYTPSLTVLDGGKLGRNDPCPCGSGKKFKKCCGK